ncbi:hypothetical protein KL915_004209 [Ogataea haglerorum]|nr:hypothetical protein KL915_004209 [Ogataea haglerorum]
MTARLLEQLSDEQKLGTLQQLLTPIIFKTTDLTPARLLDPIVAGPQQFGLVYLHLLSLLQFAFFQPYHNEIASQLKDTSFLAYRLISSQITYLVLGLGYTLVQVFFQIDIYTAYPHKLGFLIFWLVSYLVLSSLGGSEILSLWIHDAYKERLRPVQNGAVQHLQARQHAAQRVRPDRLGRGHQLPAAVHNEVLHPGQRAGEQEEGASAQKAQTAA